MNLINVYKYNNYLFNIKKKSFFNLECINVIYYLNNISKNITSSLNITNNRYKIIYKEKFERTNKYKSY